MGQVLGQADKGLVTVALEAKTGKSAEGSALPPSPAACVTAYGHQLILRNKDCCAVRAFALRASTISDSLPIARRALSLTN